MSKMLRNILIVLLMIFVAVILTSALAFVEADVWNAMPFLLFCCTVAVFVLGLYGRSTLYMLPSIFFILLYGVWFFLFPLFGWDENISWYVYSQPPMYSHFLWLLSFLAAGLLAGRLSHLLRQMDRLVLLEGSITKEDCVDFTIGLPLEKLFYREVQQEIARSRRHGRTLSLLHIQVKFYSKLERLYGEARLKEALKEFAKLLQHTFRTEDSIAYFEEGQFGVLLPDTDLAGAMYVANRFFGALGKREILAGDDGKHVLRAQIGAASFPLDADEAFALLEHAKINTIQL